MSSLVDCGNDEKFLFYFKDIFESTTLKIASIFVYLICATFFNAFSLLSVIFEKYANDSMKRSLNNQLTSHLMFGMLLNNNVILPTLVWRVIFEPIHPFIAAFVAFLRNMYVTWNTNLITLMTVVKSLLVFKWPIMARVNDVFMGKYLFQVNLL